MLAVLVTYIVFLTYMRDPQQQSTENKMSSSRHKRCMYRPTFAPRVRILYMQQPPPSRSTSTHMAIPKYGKRPVWLMTAQTTRPANWYLVGLTDLHGFGAGPHLGKNRIPRSLCCLDWTHNVWNTEQTPHRLALSRCLYAS